MPNWATNIVTIQGDTATLDEIATKLATPYEKIVKHIPSGAEKALPVTGDFLLWNIVAPDDIEAYYAEPQKPQIGDTIEESMNNAVRELQESNNWYAWNVRNWGTKWEISGAQLQKTDKSIIYTFDSAWSPPVEAIAKLASLYPQVTVSIRFVEEGMGFAGEVFFRDGEHESDAEYQINHATMLNFEDFCWVCGEGTDEYGTKDIDPELAKQYGCLEYKADIDKLNQMLEEK